MHPTQVTTAVVGTAVTLQCRGENYWSVAWSKNGIFVKTDREINSCYSGSEFHIRKATWGDKGTYVCTCTYYHRKGNLAASQTIQLVVIR